MSTYELRKKFIEIARLDKNRVEESKNQAPWIKKLWLSTSYPQGYDDRAPYCAAGIAYCLQQWLQYSDVCEALGKSHDEAERWRCKSAAAFAWQEWAENKNIQILPKYCILHTADIVIYSYSHIELVTNDDSTNTGPFVAIGYNTNAAGSREGEGCFEKPRSRDKVKCFIRILP